MRPPVRAVAGHVVWNRAGQVWALYRVQPVGSVHESHRQRLKVFARLRSAFMRLPVESQLLSIGEAVDPFSILDAITTPEDARTELGRELAARAERYLRARRVVRRSHFVAVRIDDADGDWRRQFSAGLSSVSESFGLGSAPSAATVRRYEDRAAVIAGQLGGLRLKPLTAGELCWLSARLLSRGIDDPVFDESWQPRDRVTTTGVSAPFRQVCFVEGGDRDDPGRGRLGRYVRVDTDAGVGFHTCLVVADMPARWRFPGDGELFADLESAAEAAVDGEVIEADICVRIRRVDNATALKRTNLKRTKLVHQRREYSGAATGAPGSLEAAASSLNDLEAALSSNRAEPELMCTIVVHLADASLERVQRHANSLQAQFEPANYALVRPVGDQLRLLAMMWPGSPMTPPSADYRQHLLAGDLAGMLPLTGATVGDDRGGLLGVGLDSGLSLPVLFDPGRGPRTQMPGNVAGVGEPGSGKSSTAKRMIEMVTAAGGQVITIDRTEQAEYVTFANALASTGVATQVIRLGHDTGVCLDPLRIFPASERVAVTVGFLAQLLMIDTGSLDAMVLADAVEAVSAANGTITQVAGTLEASGSAEAVVLARKLARFARTAELGDAVFGDGVALDLSAGFVVFSAAGLDLASRETLENEHLARRMLDAQVAAQALLYLVAAFARRSTFADRSRFAAALLDEWWGLASSPFGRALIREWLRDSRKHNAAVWLFSQHAADFDDEQVRSFLGTRFVFRQRTASAAHAALEFLDVADDALAERLTSADLDQGGFASGTCLMRDLTHRVGLVQVHESFHPGLRDAADTNPTTRSHMPAPGRAERSPSPMRVVPDVVALR